MSNRSILKQIVDLSNMSGRELGDQYSQLFGTEPPNTNKAYLQRKLAYRLQELESKCSLSEKATAQMRILLEENGFDPETGLAV